MKHKIWYDQENDLLRQEIHGEYSSAEAEELGQMYLEMLEGKPHRQLIVDLSDAGGVECRETRNITSAMLRQAEITHSAFVGASATARMIARIMMKLGGEELPTKFVKVDEEAVTWITKMREK